MSDRSATAFVASLLPAGFLVENASSLNIATVVVFNPVHERSYGYVAERVPGLRVVRCGGGSLHGAAAIARMLIASRAQGRDVIFFHECCWPLFDLLVGLVKPNGSFFPQVTMSGFEVVDPRDLMRAPSMPRPRALALRLLGSRFTVYRARKNSGEPGYDYFPSYRRYPPSIRVFPVGPRPQPARLARTPDDGLRVIFIGGTEVGVPDEFLRDVYRRLIAAARTAGYSVFIKDHPLSRLNVDCGEGCVEIDAALPIDLVDQRFAFAIGVASTALLTVGDRKLSIVNGLDAMPADTKRMRVKHLASIPGGDAVEFLPTIDAVCATLAAARPPAIP